MIDVRVREQDLREHEPAPVGLAQHPVQVAARIDDGPPLLLVPHEGAVLLEWRDGDDERVHAGLRQKLCDPFGNRIRRVVTGGHGAALAPPRRVQLR